MRSHFILKMILRIKDLCYRFFHKWHCHWKPLNGVVTYVNNAALKMWGSDDPAEIIGKSATVFAQSEQEALTIMHTVLEEGEWSGEITGKRKNGLPIIVLLSASLVRNDDQ